MANGDRKPALWINADIYAPDGIIKRGRILVDGEGRIGDVGGPDTVYGDDIPVFDAEGLKIVPGFIDVHVHGGNGFNAMEGTYEDLDGISRFHARHGTTSFLATTATASNERITKALEAAADAMRRGVSGAELLGIHLEGPFLNVKRSGAQSKDDIRPPDLGEIERFMRSAGQRIKLVTLAPEAEGGREAVRYFAERGVTVSAGHSDATYEQAAEAIAWGVSHTTHHFNGMSPLHHREPGLAGAGLTRPELTTELIADGIHVHPAAVKLLFDVKSPMNVCMITDAVACCGLPDGDYGRVVMTGGRIYLKDGSSLAGSSLTMLQALKNAMSFTGLPMERILPSLTRVPARQIRMDCRKGALEAGKDADFLILDQELNLISTFVAGREAYRSQESGTIIRKLK
ncbi:N-acetylglucosamine-6-phosphate deacetylase [Paenibacillus sp. MWE-103]|uniref:N-acetylglucosamine-6-phosphate deacetylase n=1 Tax=Paenibacillus artemisiicola TaxID=1172618 RepID=A0ABS3WJ34_9BACL|nr:N-acetylglucosamine-6-phosphate deacetylase [Paenibacillus artemisiicola]MBO7748343.1 N-acetylglucosamine-6-phosphate deacetylase [Paenibacillus artemisiicola]